LRAPFGLINQVKDSVDLLPRNSDDDWRNVVARMAAIQRMFATWRASLEAGLAQGMPAARRQALESSAWMALLDRIPPRVPALAVTTAIISAVTSPGAPRDIAIGTAVTVIAALPKRGAFARAPHSFSCVTGQPIAAT
jgi:hypothetical protein